MSDADPHSSKIAGIAALVPRDVCLRLADESDRLDDESGEDPVLFPAATAEEMEEIGALAAGSEEERAFAAFIREHAGKKLSEMPPPSPEMNEAMREERIEEMRCGLARSWFSIIFYCLRDSDELALDEDLLPACPLDEMLVDQGFSTWKEIVSHALMTILRDDLVPELLAAFAATMREKLAADGPFRLADGATAHLDPDGVCRVR